MIFRKNLAIFLTLGLSVFAVAQTPPVQRPESSSSLDSNPADLPDAPQANNTIHIHVEGAATSNAGEADKEEPVEQVYGSPFSYWMDDTGVPAPGWIEFNTTINALKTDQKQVMLPLFDANLGYVMPFFNLDCQLKAEIPPLTIEKDSNSTTGFTRVVGPSGVGSKCIIYDNAGHKLSIAVYPEYDWDDNGQIQHMRIPLLGVKEFKDFSLTLNLGYNQGIGAAKTFWDGGVGAGHRISNRNAVFLGTYATGEDNTQWIEFGFRRSVGPNNFNIGYSHTLGGTPYTEGNPVQKLPGQALSMSWQINKQLFHWKEKKGKDAGRDDTSAPAN